MAFCEDFPSCGHTSSDPCERQWYDEPGAFDISIPGNEHALCDHENGECQVEDYADEEGDFDNYDPDPYAEDQQDPREDDGLTDAEADAMTLTSAGWGTEEDYGYFGGNDFDG